MCLSVAAHQLPILPGEAGYLVGQLAGLGLKSEDQLLSEGKFLLKENNLSGGLFEFVLKRRCCEFDYLLEGVILVAVKGFLQFPLHPLDKAVVVIVLGLVASSQLPLLLPPPPLQCQQPLLVPLPLAPQPLHFALPLLEP